MASPLKYREQTEGGSGGVEERGKWVTDIEEGTCWDEHRVLYGNQFDNKLHILKKKKKKKKENVM